MVQVAAAIIYRDGRILICRRKEGGSCAFLWEFPGGKLEPGETMEQCVIRECKEELEINIGIKSVFASTIHRYSDRKIAFTFFNAEYERGEIKLRVHEDYKWVLPSELGQFTFCPADEDVVKSLGQGDNN